MFACLKPSSKAKSDNARTLNATFDIQLPRLNLIERHVLAAGLLPRFLLSSQNLLTKIMKPQLQENTWKLYSKISGAHSMLDQYSAQVMAQGL